MFHWEAPAEASVEDLGLDQVFGSQADAEAWLAASWEDLSDAGIESITLREADRLVYGPMLLLAEE